MELKAMLGLRQIYPQKAKLRSRRVVEFD